MIEVLLSLYYGRALRPVKHYAFYTSMPDATIVTLSAAVIDAAFVERGRR